jgi:microcompartment protein CcmK/EutM
MYLAKVIGNVVSTRKEAQLTGYKLLIVRLIGHVGNRQLLQVAIDRVGAGNHDYVLVACGSAARQGLSQTTVPVDAAIVGILDDFNEQSEVLQHGD